ncbi:glycosyltransferase family 8 protein [Auriscalpium vulgare]|uniref:Glycosyltransferase family 8 protein n=1 Tax=Auriscalpium vulgare TaxID=40419 RepID=A0ACB8S2J2_9AGAM|nr:glycosyltransferase family 8 protein [Auriscalpium vulgare]
MDPRQQAEYSFTPTQDWFSFNIDTWKPLFRLVGSTAPRVLEVGSWEGRSAAFLLKELCGPAGEIVCIDHFDLMGTDAGRERYRKFNHNLSLTGGQFRVLDQFSFPALMQVLEEEMVAPPGAAGFDWVYVDGSHEADDTFLDGELAWRLTRKNAIFIFDDYDWDAQPKDSRHHPRPGIDAFMALHEGEYRRLSSPTHYQMILQKTTDMRIGFLVKEKVNNGLDAALGYSVNVAYAIDTTYVMAAAVSIRSLFKNTSGRVSIYILDCDLSSDDKDKLTASIPQRENFTITFLNLPSTSLAAEFGPVWAKFDLVKLLPVERVLYLDADTLVRADVEVLWGTDMCGRALAAAVDVGFPMGHESIERALYFNAGVMLMDLSKIRAHWTELESLARGPAAEGKYKDQDALNNYFRGSWLELPLRWNAQGLGTYAESRSADRAELAIKDMKTASSIVHFTGPVNPGLGLVLSPWVQPFTAKPWGYAGAPGHPFASEWWQVLEETDWHGYRASKEFASYSLYESEKALEEAGRKVEEIRASAMHSASSD